MNRRQPSIDSHTFAIEGHQINEDSESNSSYGTRSSLQEDNSGINFNSTDYLSRAISDAVNSNNTLLDRALVEQAQTSGILKAKSVELRSLEQELSVQLKELHDNMSGENNDDSFKSLFTSCQRNLSWCEKHSKTLIDKVKDQWPIEYNEAEDQIATRSTYKE